MSSGSLLILVLLALAWPSQAPAADATAATSTAVHDANEADDQRQNQRQNQRQMATRFRGMDRNNDGVISRDEWQGSAQSFRVHDWNRDGMLSGDEIRAGARRPDRVDEEDFDPSTPDEFADWSEARFARLDRNRDGKLARAEWPYNAEAFYRVDRNRDGALSRAEFLGMDVEDDRDDRFEYLDTNNNGRIERREWHGSLETFRSLDRNRDNVLTRAEMTGGEPTRTHQFAALDVDASGAITPDEWLWSRRSFDSRDVDRDGRITRREMMDTTMPETAEETATQTVHVSATERWTDTGIFIRAGDFVTIDAEGTIRMSADENDVATPAGSVRNRRAPNAPVQNALAGGLIARIGETGPIFLGASGSISRAPVSGRFYFGVNDDHLGDNSGEFRVTVTIRNPSGIRNR